MLKKILSIFALAAVFCSSALIFADGATLPNLPEMVAQEGRAVVNIKASGLNENQGSTGSGFIISTDGYIVTNAHVIAKSKSIVVTLTDKRQFKAKVIGADARTDVALLKLEGLKAQESNLPVARIMSPDNLRVGDSVIAIGSPFGFENTVTAGIVSAKNRELPNESYVPFIQTDVSVNPGNSGGPLYNAKGEVVGINSQIYSRSGGFMGISFAIPINLALEVVEELKSYGHVRRGRIGVAMQELTPELAKSFGLPANTTGAIINQVVTNSPASHAGLKVADILTKVNNIDITSITVAQRQIGASKPDEILSLQIIRDKRTTQVSVKVEEQTAIDPLTQNREYQDPAQTNMNPDKLGMVLAELNKSQLASVGLTYGIWVQRVTGLAARAGVVQGDVIVGIANQPLRSRAQFLEALKQANQDKVITLQLWHEGSIRFVALPLSNQNNTDEDD
ncbi:MAG: trypsin-like peptidase domain-containing protein [Neisseriaceae bacterium]|nr:trypsin-like peptidase domain-containing protein [Neisseriaceae bacterium]